MLRDTPSSRASCRVAGKRAPWLTRPANTAALQRAGQLRVQRTATVELQVHGRPPGGGDGGLAPFKPDELDLASATLPRLHRANPVRMDPAMKAPARDPASATASRRVGTPRRLGLDPDRRPDRRRLRPAVRDDLVGAAGHLAHPHPAVGRRVGDRPRCRLRRRRGHGPVRRGAALLPDDRDRRDLPRRQPRPPVAAAAPAAQRRDRTARCATC